MSSVVVVGAGFSKHFANIPIVSEINDQIEEWLATDDQLKHLAALAPKRFEKERLEQWLSRLAEPDVWIHRNERTTALLLVDEISRRIAKLIFESQSKAIPYDSAPDHQLPTDLVVLYNIGLGAVRLVSCH